MVSWEIRPTEMTANLHRTKETTDLKTLENA